METIETLKYLVEQNQLFAYSFIFLITVIEGEVIAISAGILILLGALNFWICLLALLLGGFIKSLLGYSIGRFLKKKFDHNRFFQYIEHKVFTFMPHFEERPFWSIFISKFLMINHIVIIFSGYKKINFKKYLQAEMFSTVLWATSLLALGYFFSYAAFKISTGFTEFLLIVLLFVVAFFVIEKIVSLVYNVAEHLWITHRPRKNG